MQAERPSPTSTPKRPPAALRVVVALLPALLVLVVYWPATSHGFLIFDDPVYVSENPIVREGISGEGLLWAFNVGHAGNWHPLTWLSHMLDVELFGLEAGAHHRTSLLIHALNALLLFRFLELLLARGGAPEPAPAATLLGAGFAASLWALHPLRLESVAWIAERKDVLSGLFALLVLLIYMSYARRPSPSRYLALLVCFTLGLASKPMLVSLPLVLLLLDLWPLRRIAFGAASPHQSSISHLLLEKAPFFVLAAASAWLTLAAQRAAGAIGPLESIGPAGRLANAVVAYAAYLGSWIRPTRLAALYPLPPQGWPLWLVLGSLAILLVLSAVALLQARRRPWIAVGWAWYLIMLLPVSGLVQIGLQARADRYTYLSQIGLFVILAMCALALLRGTVPARRFAALLAPLLLGAAALSTAHQLGFWRDTVSLFGRACAVTHQNYQALYALSLEASRLGEHEEAARLARAATRQHPGLYKAHDHLGYCLAALGRTEEALTEIRTAIRLRPNYAWAHFNLGTVLLDAGRHEEAVARLERAVALAPGLADAHCNLGLALERSGQTGRAREAYLRALEIAPGLFRARLNLAFLLAGQGDEEMALEQLRLAEKARPGDSGVLLLGAGIALVRGDFDLARDYARRLRATDPAAAEALSTRIEAARAGAGGGTEEPPP